MTDRGYRYVPVPRNGGPARGFRKQDRRRWTGRFRGRRPARPRRAPSSILRGIDPAQEIVSLTARFYPRSRRSAVVEIRMSEDNDGRWTVYAPGLVVTDLTHEEAEAFAASYRRVTAA